MSHDDFDDGLIHSHDWAADTTPSPDQAKHPKVADASKMPTPSSVHHDDLMEIRA